MERWLSEGGGEDGESLIGCLLGSGVGLELPKPLAFVGEFRGGSMERLQEHRGLGVGQFVLQEALGEGLHVGLSRGAEAAVASAVESWADRAAAGLGDRPEARFLLGHDDADRAATFARLADAFGGCFWLTALCKRQNHLDELVFIDWAPAQFKIDLDMLCDRSRIGQ